MDRHAPRRLDPPDGESEPAPLGQQPDDVAVHQVHLAAHPADPEDIHQGAESGGVELRGAAAASQVRLGVDLDDQPVGACPLSGQRQRGHPVGATRRGWLGSTTTGRWLRSLTIGMAPMSRVIP